MDENGSYNDTVYHSTEFLRRLLEVVMDPLKSQNLPDELREASWDDPTQLTKAFCSHFQAHGGTQDLHQLIHLDPVNAGALPLDVATLL